ncbi:MAG: glycosyltransferase family 2 protein [Armatimonadota bacterium]
MRVSVVIITKNQLPYLEKSLPRIASQRLPGQKPEVIVVDSGSTDGARAYAEKQGVRLVCLEPHEFGFARAHNAGAEAATGDIIVRLSGDVVPMNNDWLYHLTQPFEEERVAYTWGSQTLFPSGHYSIWERWVQFVLYSRRDRGATRQVTGRAHTVLGGNMAVRRKLWQQNPYDESLPQAEDYAWAHFWLRKGDWVGVHVPQAGVFHGHEEGIWHGIQRSLSQSVLQGLILAGLIGRRSHSDVSPRHR